MKNIWQWITKYGGNAIIALLFLLFFIAGLTFKKDQAVFEKQEKTKEYILKDGTQVASSNIKEITASEIKSVIKTSEKKTKAVAKNFSKVNGITKTVNTVNIDTIQIKPKDSIKFDFNYGGEYLNKNYSFNYSVNQHGFMITDFKIIDTTVTIEGKKRNWLFGKEIDTIDQFHTNNIVKTQTIESIKTKPKKPWYWSTTAKAVYTTILVGSFISISP